MQYSLLTVFALFTAALAVSQQEHNEWVKRQAPSTQNGPPLSVAAMTDANGNVIEFDTAGVYLDAKAKGL
ncbi:hypothetical protein NKR23_g4794 [Pleurostoma richardsiae]|uniref:Uncharacterized protein n=1 Tax=Pleurostoma richardsiae TaxID=41990 RepID=A0AA38RU11_9PEZI|nr:hypothetical protein NKR23_g4794 [Pleurostoma richardsiae]